jgi:hypothetical protein
LAELRKKERKKNRCPDLVKITQHRFLGYFPNFTLFFNNGRSTHDLCTGFKFTALHLKMVSNNYVVAAKIAAESLE